MARYLPVYLPREPIALPIGSLRVYVHALAVSLCNRTTGTRIPTSSLYFPAHKFISWKIGWPTCVGSAPRRRSPPISLAKKRANRREIVRSFFTFVHSRRARKTRAHILRHSTNIEEGREEGLLEEEKLGWHDVRREDLRID